ncbi:MAG: hypothetical protein ACLR1P_01945 [Oscillospiraceae bacterium]
MQDGFLRAAAASIPVAVADPGAMRPRSARASTRRTAPTLPCSCCQSCA